MSARSILLILTIANERLARAPLEAMQAQSRKAAQFVDLSLRNAESIAAMGMAPGVLASWETHHHEVLTSQVAASRAASRVSAATKFVRQSIQVAVLGAGAYLVINLDASSGVMIAATILLGRALAPVEGVVAGWKALVDARSAYGRLDRLLRTRGDDKTVTTLPAPSGRTGARARGVRFPGSPADGDQGRVAAILQRARRSPSSAPARRASRPWRD